jgi:hypothetical protein
MGLRRLDTKPRVRRPVGRFIKLETVPPLNNIIFGLTLISQNLIINVSRRAALPEIFRARAPRIQNTVTRRYLPKKFFLT